MSRGITNLTLLLACLLAACSSSPPPTTTGGSTSSGTTTGSANPIAVSTVALLSQNNQCPDPPLQVAFDSNQQLYVVNSTLNLVLADGGITNVLPSATGIVAVAASNAGLFIAEGSPGPISIFSFGAFSQTYITGGAKGCQDGTSADAGVGFAWGRALAVDNFENIYVADWNGPSCTRIRREQGLGGQTTTISGTGNQGYANGPGISSAFHEPSGIAVDNNNSNVYVADSANNRIRVIAKDNTTSTVAGNGDAGFDDNDGPADSPTSPTFNFPTGLAVDLIGNIYVADTGNNAIRMISIDGGTTTLAGNGAAGFHDGTLGQNGDSTFDYPLSVAVDHKGNVYVADHGNCAIRVIKPIAK